MPPPGSPRSATSRRCANGGWRRCARRSSRRRCPNRCPRWPASSTPPSPARTDPLRSGFIDPQAIPRILRWCTSTAADSSWAPITPSSRWRVSSRQHLERPSWPSTTGWPPRLRRRRNSMTPSLRPSGRPATLMASGSTPIGSRWSATAQAVRWRPRLRWPRATVAGRPYARRCCCTQALIAT